MARDFVRSRTRLSSTNATSTTVSSSGSSAPKKASNIVQKLVFYLVTATGTFVSYQNQQYRDRPHRVVVATVDTAKAVYDFVQRQLGQVTQKTDTPVQDASVDKEAPHESKKSSLHETKAWIKSTAAALKTTAAALAKHKAQQLASEVDELIRKAEVALAVLVESASESTPTPAPANVEVFILTEKSDDPNVYAALLPIGFEPPPGFSKLNPTPKPAQADVLLVVALAVSDVAVSEPVISHLAGTIDDLASYLKANPAAAEKAKGILDTARTDLTELATRFDKIKEDEKHELEAKLVEQAREYSTKLLELELESQDKLALQREDYEKYVGEEKMKLVQAYRERLETELKAQTELTNDHLKEAIIAQSIELQRRWIREVKVKVEERGGRIARLD
ncbi:mitochondrial inner membrane protein Mitofilin [Chiua virens]|nr:mitochondrial inner membrane protein Mitofilin [Chiua virens]